MKFRTPGVTILAFAFLSACLGPGCDNTANEGGDNATKSIKDQSGPKSQEEYYKAQLEKSAAAKKAAQPGK